MFELRPFERRNNHVAAYDPWDQMERAFFGDGSWGRGLSEFKTDIQDKGDSYLLEADLPGFKKEDIHVDVDGDTMTIRAERHSEQFVRFLQDLFAIAKTHNRRQQTADFDILFQRITMGKLHRIALYKVCAMIHLRTH